MTTRPRLVTLALCCPKDTCRHAFRADSLDTAVDQMIDHLIDAHELPEISASFHAMVAKPITLDPGIDFYKVV
jgi:hypothetical protein